MPSAEITAADHRRSTNRRTTSTAAVLKVV
jgi:hypothetical protein